MKYVIDTDKPNEPPTPLTQVKLNLLDANQTLDKQIADLQERNQQLELHLRRIARELEIPPNVILNTSSIYLALSALKSRAMQTATRMTAANLKIANERDELVKETKRLKGVLQSLHKMTKFSAEDKG